MDLIGILGVGLPIAFTIAVLAYVYRRQERTDPPEEKQRRTLQALNQDRPTQEDTHLE
jgi:hypothetical protein